ncbi:hypothetical protein GCM10010984_24610 [Chishuiella changwenlii]|uniref:Uncharacterized protein n=1 Tax=Chishuiella changwenlii TaxID=1434701 RepID=A0ABQ1U1T7_9FLAO|nr:hypothetical protein GCM10010984_24610 [Chishuiella changwenlii]
MFCAKTEIERNDTIDKKIVFIIVMFLIMIQISINPFSKRIKHYRTVVFNGRVDVIIE